MESLEMQTWLQEIIDHLNESFQKKKNDSLPILLNNKNNIYF